jgi:hypothetical protein
VRFSRLSFILIQILTVYNSFGIARMFGGFPSTFFETYLEYNPKSEPQNQYSYRCELYESFHYLNHTVIFGVSLIFGPFLYDGI